MSRLEEERRHLERVLGWEGYKVVDAQDQGDAYTFILKLKVKKK